MIKRSAIILLILSMGVFILSACSDKEETSKKEIPVPDKLIKKEDPLKIKDQLGLEIGENGFVIDWANSNILEITLNSVEITPEIDGQTPVGNDSEDDVYVIGNFTVKNHGDVGIPGQGVEYPVLIAGEDKEKIINDGFEGPQELLGSGDTATPIDEALNKQKPTEPGEDRTGNVILLADHEVDSYIIYFGYEGYDNKLTWEFDAAEAE